MCSRIRQRPIIGDTLADEIAAKIDYGFADGDVPRYVVCQQALRAKMLGRLQTPDSILVGERP